MARSRFRPDRGLAVRMGVTMFLLGLLYVVFIGALVAASVSWFIILVVVGGFAFFQYFASDKIALFSMGAVEVSPNDGPDAARLHAIVDRLCALADMPKPRVAIARSNIPNAFATGRNEKQAVVCATTGILAKLENEELEGVLAHELSHVAHRDVLVMTVASFIGILAGILTRIAFYSEMFGGGRRRDSNDNTAAVMAVVMLASAVVYMVSFLLIRALSRYRELAADRAGAQLTGRPSALASALVKVSGDMARIPTNDLRRAEPLNAFFFSPLHAPGFSLSSLFSTHPSLERRLEQLEKISAQLGQPV